MPIQTHGEPVTQMNSHSNLGSVQPLAMLHGMRFVPKVISDTEDAP
jgi:hypothetical protein